MIDKLRAGQFALWLSVCKVLVPEIPTWPSSRTMKAVSSYPHLRAVYIVNQTILRFRVSAHRSRNIWKQPSSTKLGLRIGAQTRYFLSFVLFIRKYHCIRSSPPHPFHFRIVESSSSAEVSCRVKFGFDTLDLSVKCAAMTWRRVCTRAMFPNRWYE